MRTVMGSGLPLVVVMALVAAGCGSSTSPASSTTVSSTAASSDAETRATGSITVSIAASLTDAFDEIGTAFSKANSEASVTLNAGSSSTLARQIEQGAPADVFASADEASMDELVAADLVDGQPVVFAANRLAIVTKPGNPQHVTSLADLARLDVVALCGREVPCGKYAARVLRRAGVTIPERSVTRGQDVTATLGAVTTGDADAGIVYATDAERVRTDVATVTIPDARNVIARYPIAVLATSADDATAHAFVDFVTSRAGRAILRTFGFLAPS